MGGGLVQRGARRPREHMRGLSALSQWTRGRPPITKTYPLAQAAQALRDVMERRVKGKVVILPRS